MQVNEILTEKTIKISAYAKDVIVHENPSAQQMVTLLEKHQPAGLRGFVLEDDYYVWNAYDLIHEAVRAYMYKLGYPTKQGLNDRYDFVLGYNKPGSVINNWDEEEDVVILGQSNLFFGTFGRDYTDNERFNTMMERLIRMMERRNEG